MPRDPRPSWVDKRFSWFLGEPVDCKIHFREPITTDIRQLVKLSHAAGNKLTKRSINRIFNCNEWSCWVAVRNYRTAVGFSYAVCSPSSVDIKQLYVAPEYRDLGIEDRFLVLLGLELPEAYSRFTTRISNTYHSKIFDTWKAESADEVNDTVTYHRRFIIPKKESPFEGPD